MTDWLESGVAQLSDVVPPGRAATQAREWSAEVERRTGVLADGAQLLGERAAITGDAPRGQVSAGGACRMLACADGWIAVSLPRPGDLELIPPLVEAQVTEPWEAVSDWAAGHPAFEVVERGRLLGLAISHVGGERVPPLTLPPAVPEEPLTSPLVVDFSALWAGPLCASLLGLGGAHAIKVETPDRPDGARFGHRQFYDLLHAGHQSLVIDPVRDGDALRALVTRADVVIEASRPRALAGWGLSAADAVAAGTVWVSITGYGREHGDRIGFGDDVAAGAGLTGWSDGAPLFIGDAIADPLTGLAAAVAALRALASRARDGRGVLIDLAMAAVVACTLDGSPAVAKPSGAAQPAARTLSSHGR